MLEEKNTAQKMMFPGDLVTFTEEIPDGKLYFFTVNITLFDLSLIKLFDFHATDDFEIFAILDPAFLVVL